MTTAEQRRAAGQASNVRRAQLAEIYRDLRTGASALDAVLSDPPDALKEQLLIDVVRRGTRGAQSRRGAIVTAIGKRAVMDGVNLMAPVGKASARSRAWVAQYGYHSTGSPGWPRQS